MPGFLEKRRTEYEDKERLQGIPADISAEASLLLPEYCPKKQVLNIGSSLTIQVDLDWDVLKSCIQEAIARCDTMRLRFTHDKEGNIYQYVVKEETKESNTLTLPAGRRRTRSKRLREWTEVPFERYDSPMHHIVMIKMPDGYQGLYICVDHMTMDAQSLILFFRDVIELYASRFYDEVEHPKEMSSYIRQLEKDLAYEAGSRACEKTGSFSRN